MNNLEFILLPDRNELKELEEELKDLTVLLNDFKEIVEIQNEDLSLIENEIEKTNDSLKDVTETVESIKEIGYYRWYQRSKFAVYGGISLGTLGCIISPQYTLGGILLGGLSGIFLENIFK